MNRRLIFGDGLLGSEIQRQTKWDYISRKKDGFDFTKLDTYIHLISGYDEIINCIAHTDTYSPEGVLHWETNYAAVVKLVDYCKASGKKLTHISTDYIYANSYRNAKESEVPAHEPNWYSYTKLLGDAYVQLKLKDYILVRTSFKPRPFKHPKAFTNLVGNFDYVDVIASLIIKLIEKNAFGVFNVGTERKSMYQLAKETVPAVEPMFGKVHETMPTNIVMNIGKLEEFLNEI